MSQVDLYFADVWEGERYALWVRKLKGRSGVYVIRSNTTDEILYVGESHENRLYQTLTRHFQQWNDRYEIDPAGGRHGGPTYDRNRVEVAAHLCAGSVAAERQYEFIHELEPRDNQVTNAGAFEDDEDENETENKESLDEDDDFDDSDEDGNAPF